MNNNVRLQYSEKDNLITIDSYNQKTKNWVEIGINDDNSLYKSILEVYKNLL